jgi:hypothetical protein
MMMYEFIREVLGETGRIEILLKEGIFHKIWLLIILDLDVQCQEWVRNLTEGKHRELVFIK